METKLTKRDDEGLCRFYTLDNVQYMNINMHKFFFSICKNALKKLMFAKVCTNEILLTPNFHKRTRISTKKRERGNNR